MQIMFLQNYWLANDLHCHVGHRIDWFSVFDHRFDVVISLYSEFVKIYFHYALHDNSCCELTITFHITNRGSAGPETNSTTEKISEYVAHCEINQGGFQVNISNRCLSIQ
jgi:hypothetical protein